MPLKSVSLLIILLIQFSGVFGQCTMATARSCSVEADGYNLLKTYLLDGTDEFTKSSEYSFVLYKGREYVIKFCEGGKDFKSTQVALLDKDHNEIVSTEIVAVQNGMIRFQCSASSIYYIRFETGRKSKMCTTALLGFRRNKVTEAASSN